MTRFSAEVLRGARVRAPGGIRWESPPRVPGSTTSPELRVLAIGGAWPRRHVLTPDAAALIASLESPRRLPRGKVPGAVLMRMVLDGLLEVELAGRFRAGGAAHRRLFAPSASVAPRSRILQLSREALTCAAFAAPRSAHELADRLYRSNAMPRSPAWLHRCPNDRAAADFLAPTPGSGRPTSAVVGPWRVWDAARPETRRDRGMAPTYKLYVSALPASTGTAAAALLETLSHPNGPFSCKLGQDVPSVLRPDRLIAYFDTLAALRATAAYLMRALSGTPGHGVPFTSPLDRVGLLSWGADFAYSGAFGSHQRERSWRGWVTSRLATALVTADRSGAADPVAFAMDRVALDGVQVESWKPSSTLLRQQSVGAIDVAA